MKTDPCSFDTSTAPGLSPAALFGPGPSKTTTSFWPGLTNACTSVPLVASTPVGRVMDKLSGFCFVINPVTTFKEPWTNSAEIILSSLL